MKKNTIGQLLYTEQISNYSQNDRATNLLKKLSENPKFIRKKLHLVVASELN